jgi:hypothetical protein
MHAYPGRWSVSCREESVRYSPRLRETPPLRRRRPLVIALLAFGIAHTVWPATWYVATNGTDAADGTTWATAKQTIQAAVDLAVSNDTVLVSNGVYATGGRVVFGSMTNRVAITNAITVQSVNGPEVTVIKGARDPLTTNGNAAVRCAYVGINAVLSGFTLTDGATRRTGDYMQEQSGGGAWCEASAVLSNCMLSSNSAAADGGGSFFGTLNNCTLSNNAAASYGGGSCFGTMSNCVLSGNSADGGGGGSYYSTLNNCTLSGNSAAWGGGSYYGSLNNCTLSGNSADEIGGGSSDCTLNTCTLSDNSAGNGGGSVGGALNNCMLRGNAADGVAGGSWYGTLNNCTLIGNSAETGGGSFSSTLNNCIVYYNAALNGPNYYEATFNYSCTTPIPIGMGNISSAPLIASISNPHLLEGSPCVDAGANEYATGTDIDGELRIANGTVDIGCDEQVIPLSGSLAVQIKAMWTNCAPGFAALFEATIEGNAQGLRWDWGDGTAATNLFLTAHAYTGAGVYAVVLIASNALGAASATVAVHVASSVFYVTPYGSNLAPYTSWGTAATDIQAAVDVADIPGALILVSNGVYATGGRVIHGAMTNRVAVTKPITVRSVNGPAETVIKGAWDPVTTNGDAAVRCVYLAAYAVLSGFTLTNGATRAAGDSDLEQTGGGVWCDSSAVVRDCTLSGNSASSGGGSSWGTLYNCVLTGNSAIQGGGSQRGMLNDSTLSGNSAHFGGASFAATLNNCILVGNSAWSNGGGSVRGTLNNCTLTGNSAAYSGGGSYRVTLNNCTLTGNSAIYGGGSYDDTLNNCIIYYNTAPRGADHGVSTLNYSCTRYLTGGTGNITNDPQFVNAAVGDYRLSVGSPCMDRGSDAYVQGTTDLDGNPRIMHGRVDMGAYEFQGPWDYWFWAAAITNGLTNENDCATGDGYPNLLKYATGSSATNPDGFAHILGGRSNGLFFLEFNRNTNAVDATMIVEGAEEIADGVLWFGIATNVLGSWGGATNVIEMPASTPVVVRVADPVPATNRFLRLRVSR